MIFDIIKARQMFEPEIAAVAAMNRTEEQLHGLNENVKALKRCPLHDIETEVEIDNKFHLLISGATHNAVVTLLMGPVFEVIPKFKKAIFAKSKMANIKGEKNILIQFHEDIYNAICNKDSREAYYSMREHIKRSERNYRNSLQ